MPAKSEAQRKLLNAKFGHQWVKKHHFDNKGKLPAKVESLARTLIEGHSGGFRGWGGRGDWHGGRTRKLADAEHRREAAATDKRHNDWAKEHGVKCTCGAPSGSNHSSVCAIFKGYHAQNEGRDDAPKLGLGKTGLKFARMNSKEAFKTTDGTDEKWKTSLKLRAHLAGEKPSAKMQSRDAVGKVPRAMKGLGEQITAEQVVAKLLD